MRRDKLGLVSVLPVMALVGGCFFSNYGVLLFLGMRDAPQAWNTWWQYFQALALPQFAPFAGKIKLRGAVGFGLPVLAGLFLLIPLFKARPESLYGDARFADLADLRKAGLL